MDSRPSPLEKECDHEEDICHSGRAERRDAHNGIAAAPRIALVKGSRGQAANVPGSPGAGLQLEAVMDMEQTSEPVASVIAGSSVPADEATVWLQVANAAARRAHALPGIPPVRFVDATSEMFGQHGVQLASGSAARIYIGLTDTTQAMVRERADNPTRRPEYVARVIQGMPAALREPARDTAGRKQLSTHLFSSSTPNFIAMKAVWLSVCAAFRAA
jgi:hypothetical protein